VVPRASANGVTLMLPLANAAKAIGFYKVLAGYAARALST